MVNETTVDYLVVGAGTAGCIVAARLSEDPAARVALLELGGMDKNPAIYDQSSLNPMFRLWDPNGRENWGYVTEPQAGLNGRKIDIARGRVLGGSSAINAMIYARGNRRDFDSLASLGNDGWSYADVLPYFKRSEHYHGSQPREFHGDAGPLSVIDLPLAICCWRGVRGGSRHPRCHRPAQRLQWRISGSGCRLLSIHQDP